MRSLYFTFLLTCTISLAKAQCTPDPSIMLPGLYPEVLPDGCANANYSEQLNLAFASDTVVTTPFGALTVPFDSIRISVSGLPNGLSFECATSNCTVVAMPGQMPRTCMYINGLPTTATALNNTFTLDIEYWITLFGSAQMLTDEKSVGLTINDEVNVAVVNNGTMLTAQSATGTFQWVDCDNGFAAITDETSASFTPSVSGNYAVAVTEGTCVAISECQSVSLNGISHMNSIPFNVFPTLAHDNITVEIPNINGPIALSLIEATGRVVHETTINAAKTTINVSSLSKGVYIVRLAQNGAFSVRKLMVD